MEFDLPIAEEFFSQWRSCSVEMMDVLCPTCPTFPKGPTKHGKYRPWGNPGDTEGPIGIIFHYTGGPDGVASMRWGNENKMNNNSSWHVTVLDHLISEVEPIREKYPLVAKYLPVTAFLHADIGRGTWHGNWTNSRCFGIENRNVGCIIRRNGRFGRITSNRFREIKDQTRAISINGRLWESYSAEQLLANINIGKMIFAWRGDKLDKRWILPHQFIWASKSDTGPAFPLSFVREHIFNLFAIAQPDCSGLSSSSEPINAMTTLPMMHDESYIIDEDRSDESAEVLNIPSSIHRTAASFTKADGIEWRSYLPAIRRNLNILGGCCSIPDAKDVFDLDADLRLATTIFQRSTWAKWKGPRLKVDGIPGAKTRKAIELRLSQFGYKM